MIGLKERYAKVAITPERQDLAVLAMAVAVAITILHHPLPAVAGTTNHPSHRISLPSHRISLPSHRTNLPVMVGEVVNVQSITNGIVNANRHVVGRRVGV